MHCGRKLKVGHITQVNCFIEVVPKAGFIVTEKNIESCTEHSQQIKCFIQDYIAVSEGLYLIVTPRYSWNIAKVGIKHQSINHVIDRSEHTDSAL